MQDEILWLWCYAGFRTTVSYLIQSCLEGHHHPPHLTRSPQSPLLHSLTMHASRHNLVIILDLQPELYFTNLPPKLCWVPMILRFHFGGHKRAKGCHQPVFCRFESWRRSRTGGSVDIDGEWETGDWHGRWVWEEQWWCWQHAYAVDCDFIISSLSHWFREGSGKKQSAQLHKPIYIP